MRYTSQSSLKLCALEMQVHEDNNTVTVQAGVTQRILLDYLAAYMCADPLPAHGPLQKSA